MKFSKMSLKYSEWFWIFPCSFQFVFHDFWAIFKRHLSLALFLKYSYFFNNFEPHNSYEKNSCKKHSVLIIKYNLVNKHFEIKISIKRNSLNVFNRITMINTIQLKDNNCFYSSVFSMIFTTYHWRFFFLKVWTKYQWLGLYLS